MEGSLITIKEEFLGSDKWRRAVEIGGSDAIVMWLAIKGHCATNLTDGFAASEDLPVLPGAPKRWKRAIEALVGCGRLRPDGSRGAGLLDREEHGVRLHDYLDHATSRAEEEERRRRSRDKQAAYRRRQRDLAAGGEVTGNDDGNAAGDNTSDIPESYEAPTRGRAHAGTGAPTPPPHPLKSKAVEADPKDLPGQTDVAGPDIGSGSHCPTSLTSALKLDVKRRSEAILANPHMADWCEPHLWPEVFRAVETLSGLIGTSVRIGQWSRDKGVQAVVQAFAAGFTPDEYCALLPGIVSEPWWSTSKHGLSSISLEVLRRASAASVAKPTSKVVQLTAAEDRYT